MTKIQKNKIWNEQNISYLEVVVVVVEEVVEVVQVSQLEMQHLILDYYSNSNYLNFLINLDQEETLLFLLLPHSIHTHIHNHLQLQLLLRVHFKGSRSACRRRRCSYRRGHRGCRRGRWSRRKMAITEVADLGAVRHRFDLQLSIFFLSWCCHPPSIVRSVKFITTARKKG